MNKINYKLINTVLIIAIICLLYLIKGLWLGAFKMVLSILFPFFLSFAIAYALYPLVKKLRDSGAPKWLAITTILIITFGILLIVLILAIPLLYEQILLFISNISVFVSDISSKFEIDLKILQTSLKEISEGVMSDVGSLLSNGAINVLNTGVNFITNAIIVLAAALYFIIDMDKIRNSFKKYLSKRQKKTYRYFKKLDIEITKYVGGMGKNILIQGLEYTFAFFIIGHPNYLILGLLSGISTLIPWFGGFFVSLIALLISSVISTKLFILTAIVCVVCPQIDGYIIGPKIYGKSNQLHPLIVIFAVFAGGIIGGFWGILLSVPVAIIIITTYKFFELDINDKINEIKGNRR